jgi:hypothetical protein
VQRISYGKLCKTLLRLGLPEWIALNGTIQASSFVFMVSASYSLRLLTSPPVFHYL